MTILKKRKGAKPGVNIGGRGREFTRRGAVFKGEGRTGEDSS